MRCRYLPELSLADVYPIASSELCEAMTDGPILFRGTPPPQSWWLTGRSASPSLAARNCPIATSHRLRRALRWSPKPGRIVAGTLSPAISELLPSGPHCLGQRRRDRLIADGPVQERRQDAHQDCSEPDQRVRPRLVEGEAPRPGSRERAELMSDIDNGEQQPQVARAEDIADETVGQGHRAGP